MRIQIAEVVSLSAEMQVKKSRNQQSYSRYLLNPPVSSQEVKSSVELINLTDSQGVKKELKEAKSMLCARVDCIKTAVMLRKELIPIRKKEGIKSTTHQSIPEVVVEEISAEIGNMNSNVSTEKAFTMQSKRWNS